MFWTGHGTVWHGRIDIVLSTNPEIAESTDQSSNGITLFLKKGLVY